MKRNTFSATWILTIESKDKCYQIICCYRKTKESLIE